MKQLVIMSGGFHPFHAGHMALYQAAREQFPGADIVVGATDVQARRPFPFKIKQKLAQLSGVPPKDFVQVQRQFSAADPSIVNRVKNPEDTALIFVRSDKDQGKAPMPAAIDPATGQLPLVTRGANKGKPVSNYLQYYSGNENQLAPMTQHAYMAYLPTVEFGPGMTSATEIRTAWPTLNEKRKTALVMSLYPRTQSNPKLATTVVKLLDTAMGSQGVAEGLEHYNGIEISMEKEDDEIMVTAMMSGGRELGHVLFVIDGEYLAPQDLEVDERYQGQGIAATMYDYVKSKGYKIRRSGQQTDAGAGFWDKHKPGKNVWEQGMAETVNPMTANTAGAGAGMTAGYQRRENQPISESTSLKTTLKAIVNDTGEPVTATFETLKYLAKRYVNAHGELDRGWRMVAMSTGAKWTEKFYKDKLKNELYDLVKYRPNDTADLKDFLRGVEIGGELETKRSFSNISNTLPEILADLGYRLQEPQLIKNAQRWVKNLKDYHAYLASLEADDDDDYSAPAPTKSTLPGQQNAQVEQLVNDLLSKLPKNVAGDIRNAIARSPNKLQALQQELTRRNIAISENQGWAATLEALKPEALTALQQAKQNIEQNRQQEIDQWAQDFQANTAAKFAPRPKPAALPPVPVAQPGERFHTLKDRLAQLDIARRKFEEFNKLSAAIKKKYPLVADELDRIDNSLLQDVKDGAADNYASLLTKLSKYENTLTTRFPGIVKEDPDYIEEKSN